MKSFLTVLLLTATSSVYGDVKGSLGNCLNNDPDKLNSCHIELTETLRVNMRTGIPEYNVEQGEPLLIPELQFNLNDAASKLKAEFHKNIISGLSNFIVNDFRTNTERNLLFVDLTIPELSATGQYALDGTISLVDVESSSGDFQMTMTDVSAILVAKLSKVNGKVVIEENPRMTIKVKEGNMKVNMENLFGGKAPNLAEVVHTVINRSPDLFLEDFKPVLRIHIGGMLKNLFNAVADNVDPAIYGL
ncbi:uncharacterized protein LOC111714488 [Eurytemora carolleeae]|uniref:uncharacterized protein LOC111714488 n=1 Tax=Eurytemora carolleeae TaxID=1294199 RepID=UPI000C7865FE|nr:uncharacterized protein LOC111714488 [Eurytemora carolleeae]|eukprot:XP_023345378.1 uncharacterized protein LOC111714488 [Eurytemora affinis]